MLTADETDRDPSDPPEREGAEQGGGSRDASDAPSSAGGVLRRLRAAGLLPQKRRGQHFLHDPKLLTAVVDDAEVLAEDSIFEVGTGPATLTRHLARRSARVLTVEIDPAMFAFAQSELAGYSNVEALCADALEGGRLNPKVERALVDLQPFGWVSNLPYSIAATLTVALLESTLSWKRALLLVQSEVADRLCAAPGTRVYGPVSALVAYWATCRRGRRVEPGAFWPRPRVRSCFVELTPGEPLGSRQDYPAYAALVRYLFRGRRKQLRRLLTDLIGGPQTQATLARLALDPQTRPERLQPFDVLRLSREIPSDAV